MRSSLASGKSSTPPVRCIHRPQRDTSSAGYRLLVSLASVGASHEPESCRSPALAPHTCAISPTFCYGAFLFAAFALADLSPARLTACVLGRASIRHQSDSNRLYVPTLFTPNRHHQATTRKHGFYNGSAGPQLLDLTYYLATSLILNCRRFCDNCQRRLAMRMFRPPKFLSIDTQTAPCTSSAL